MNVNIKFYNQISLLLLLSLSIIKYASGQESIDETKIVTVNEDITQYGITSLLKDKEGFIWIGTFGDGVYKYNSIEFINYNQEFRSDKNSLNSSIVHTIHEDLEGNIWIGTDQGLNLYNKNLDDFNNSFSDLTKKKEKFPIHSIINYEKDIFLLGTHGNGLFKFDKKNFKYEPVTFKGKGTGGLLINKIIKSNTGKFLIGTNYGLMIYDVYKNEFQLAKIDIGNEYDYINNSIQSMILAKDNSIWIGTFSSGLYKLNENDNGVFSIKHFKISEKRILSLTEKINGNILCGTENDGLFEYIQKSGEIKNYKYNRLNSDGLKSNSIWTVYNDDKDRIWIGYYNKGIDVYDDSYSKFNSFKNSPSQTNSLNSNSVTAIANDKHNRLWIGLLDGGVDVYDPSNNTFINLFDSNNPIANGLNAQDVQTVFIDSKNNVWVGTWNYGLFILKNNKKRFINISKNSSKSIFKSNRVMSFSEDSNGTIWIGTFLSGLYSYNPNNEKFTHHTSNDFSKLNINTSNIRKVLVDSDDNIWIGSRLGVFRVIKNSNSSYDVSSLNKKMNIALGKKMESSIVFSLFEDNNKYLWIGTKGRGLFRYDKIKDSIEWYNSSKGLIHETISSITQDQLSHLWLAGNNGLSKLDLQNNKFINYNKSDGLLSNNFNFNSVHKSFSNELYFGNSKGINFFNPNTIKNNKEKPIVYLTNLKISNEKIRPSIDNSPLNKVISKTDYLSLNYDQSSFSIEFAGINYTRSEDNQYAYLLEGYDDDWNYIKNVRNASFKGVPPGDYTFKVKASNNDGVWNEFPTSINIEILPAWWASNNAFLFYFILILFLAYLIPKIISERIKEKRTLITERQERKQFEILNSKKIQFFTNISHEFRTPLTLILSPLEDIINQNIDNFSREVKEKHHTIHKNAKRLSRLINELMDFRKLQFNKMTINASRIKIVPFIQEVLSHFEDEAVLKNIDLVYDFQDEGLIVWSDPSMLEKIIFNLISNAFKASSENGVITIEVNKPNDFILFPLINDADPKPAIEIIIKDTGVGIKKENINKVFNRFYQVNEMNNQYYGGTGIGLELVKSFVDLHKGKIDLISKENFGTTFTVYFPLGNTHLSHSDFNESFDSNSQYSIINDQENDDIIKNNYKNKRTILIVEDNIELRTYVKKQLEKEYFIKEAENGKEGFEKAIKFVPDIIITDVMMPVMDGIELCKLIKNDIKTSHIPLLMITAKGMQIDKVKGIDSGADVYLNKPFNMGVLESYLKQLITSRQILFDKYFTEINDSDILKNTTSLDKQFITNIIAHINENINDEKLNVEHLAGELFLSRSKLYRKIKALTGDTANEFIRKVRLKKAKQIIEASNYTISEVCYKVGFSSPSYFTKCFKEHFGILPKDMREKVDVG